MFVDDILARGFADWAICGVGVLEGDRAVRDALRAQDNLYTLVTNSPDGTSVARVIGSIREYLYAPDDPERGPGPPRRPGDAHRLADDHGGRLQRQRRHRRVRPARPAHAARSATRRRPPASVLGYLTAGLARRRAAGTPAFTVVSCDNIQGNGHVARTAVLGFAARNDPDLAAWIAQNVAFPNSMVDRITPVTTAETRASVLAEYGIEDRWPVRAESFAQWVLEDTFPGGRPPLELVGVQTGRRRRAVRADEAEALERLASGDGLSRHPGRRTVGPRGVPGSPVHGFSPRLHALEAIPTLHRCRASTWTPTAAN
jgi:mannitol 2-dehydrogenase